MRIGPLKLEPPCANRLKTLSTRQKGQAISRPYLFLARKRLIVSVFCFRRFLAFSASRLISAPVTGGRAWGFRVVWASLSPSTLASQLESMAFSEKLASSVRNS